MNSQSSYIYIVLLTATEYTFTYNVITTILIIRAFVKKKKLIYDAIYCTVHSNGKCSE